MSSNENREMMSGLKQLLAIIHRFSDLVENCLIIISGACLIAGTVMMLLEVIARYITGISIIWAEEFVRFVNIWFVFLLVGPLAKRASHLSVSALYNRFSLKIRKILSCSISIINIAICILLVQWGIGLTRLLKQMGFKSVTDSIFHPWTWRLSIPVSMVFAIFFLIEYMLSQLIENDS